MCLCSVIYLLIRKMYFYVSYIWGIVLGIWENMVSDIIIFEKCIMFFGVDYI